MRWRRTCTQYKGHTARVGDNAALSASHPAYGGTANPDFARAPTRSSPSQDAGNREAQVTEGGKDRERWVRSPAWCVDWLINANLSHRANPNLIFESQSRIARIFCSSCNFCSSLLAEVLKMVRYAPHGHGLRGGRTGWMVGPDPGLRVYPLQKAGKDRATGRWAFAVTDMPGHQPIRASQPPAASLPLALPNQASERKGKKEGRRKAPAHDSTMTGDENVYASIS